METALLENDTATKNMYNNILVEHGIMMECAMRSAGGPRLADRVDAMWDQLFAQN